MRRIRFLIGLLLIPLAVQAQPDTLWTYTYASPYNDDAYAIAPVADGGFVVGGKTWNPDSGYRPLLIRLDAEGQEQWARVYPRNPSSVNAIASLANGGWALASGAGPFCRMMIIRTDSLGNMEWLRCINHVYMDKAVGIAATPDGGMAALSEGGWGIAPDIYLVRLNGDGDSLWAQSYGGPAEDHGGAVLLTDDDGFFIAGSTNHQAWAIKTDSLGVMQWDTTFGDPTLTERLLAACRTPTGDFAVAGWWQNNSSSAYNPFAACVSASGDTMWTRVFPNLGHGLFTSVSCLPDGNIVLGGRGSDTYVVVLLTAAGDTLWTARYDTPIDDVGTALCLAPDSGFAMAGYRHTMAENSHDIWVVRSESLYATSANQRIPPLQFALTSAYPNPFNGATTIRFSLPRPMRVALRVYNVLGREVITLVDGRISCGESQVIFDGGGLPSGVYFARLNAGEFAATRKLLLLR